MADEKTIRFLRTIENPAKMSVKTKGRDLQILLNRLGYDLAFDEVERLIVLKQILEELRDLLKAMYNSLGWVLRDVCGFINKSPKYKELLMRLPLRLAWNEIRRDLEQMRDQTKVISDYIETQMLAVFDFTIDTLSEWLERGNVHEVVRGSGEKLEKDGKRGEGEEDKGVICG